MKYNRIFLLAVWMTILPILIALRVDHLPALTIDKSLANCAKPDGELRETYREDYITFCRSAFKNDRSFLAGCIIKPFCEENLTKWMSETEMDWLRIEAKVRKISIKLVDALVVGSGIGLLVTILVWPIHHFRKRGTKLGEDPNDISAWQLNGWQRIGIVLSVVWVPSIGIYMYIREGSDPDLVYTLPMATIWPIVAFWTMSYLTLNIGKWVYAGFNLDRGP